MSNSVYPPYARPPPTLPLDVIESIIDELGEEMYTVSRSERYGRVRRQWMDRSGEKTLSSFARVHSSVLHRCRSWIFKYIKLKMFSGRADTIDPREVLFNSVDALGNRPSHYVKGLFLEMYTSKKIDTGILNSSPNPSLAILHLPFDNLESVYLWKEWESRTYILNEYGNVVTQTLHHLLSTSPLRRFKTNLHIPQSLLHALPASVEALSLEWANIDSYESGLPAVNLAQGTLKEIELSQNYRDRENMERWLEERTKSGLFSGCRRFHYELLDETLVPKLRAFLQAMNATLARFELNYSAWDHSPEVNPTHIRQALGGIPFPSLRHFILQSPRSFILDSIEENADFILAHLRLPNIQNITTLYMDITLGEPDLYPGHGADFRPNHSDIHLDWIQDHLTEMDDILSSSTVFPRLEHVTMDFRYTTSSDNESDYEELDEDWTPIPAAQSFLEVLHAHRLMTRKFVKTLNRLTSQRCVIRVRAVNPDYSEGRDGYIRYPLVSMDEFFWG